jgi:hypothetical protein
MKFVVRRIKSTSLYLFFYVYFIIISSIIKKLSIDLFKLIHFIYLSFIIL